MKKFSFSLQNVLNLRTFTEDNAKAELGKAVSESNRIKAELEAIAQKVASASLSRSGADIDMLRSIEAYLNGLNLKKDALLEALAKNELLVDAVREVFVKAQTERKAITKLYDKQLSAYKKEAEKQEEKERDDRGKAER